MNAKLDQENYVIRGDVMDKILGVNPVDILVLGLTVYPGRTYDPEAYPSIVALCASRTRHFNKYTTALRRQNARQEFVEDNLSPMLHEVLTGRDKLPSTIILYRAGVSMLDKRIHTEIHKLQTTLHAIYSNKRLPLPRLTYIVVQKRRSFVSQCTDPSSRDSNAPPGTLVDDVIVLEAGHTNFYLYSHTVFCGTARPCHYTLLCNSNNFSPYQLANFTYALCHLHQGCSESISFPVPIYYAKLAARIAACCFGEGVEAIQDRLKQMPYMI